MSATVSGLASRVGKSVVAARISESITSTPMMLLPTTLSQTLLTQDPAPPDRSQQQQERRGTRQKHASQSLHPVVISPKGAPGMSTTTAAITTKST